MSIAPPVYVGSLSVGICNIQDGVNVDPNNPNVEWSDYDTEGGKSVTIEIAQDVMTVTGWRGKGKNARAETDAPSAYYGYRYVDSNGNIVTDDQIAAAAGETFYKEVYILPEYEQNVRIEAADGVALKVAFISGQDGVLLQVPTLTDHDIRPRVFADLSRKALSVVYNRYIEIVFPSRFHAALRDQIVLLSVEILDASYTDNSKSTVGSYRATVKLDFSTSAEYADYDITLPSGVSADTKVWALSWQIGTRSSAYVGLMLTRTVYVPAWIGASSDSLPCASRYTILKSVSASDAPWMVADDVSKLFDPYRYYRKEDFDTETGVGTNPIGLEDIRYVEGTQAHYYVVVELCRSSRHDSSSSPENPTLAASYSSCRC